MYVLASHEEYLIGYLLDSVFIYASVNICLSDLLLFKMRHCRWWQKTAREKMRWFHYHWIEFRKIYCHRIWHSTVLYFFLFLWTHELCFPLWTHLRHKLIGRETAQRNACVSIIHTIGSGMHDESTLPCGSTLYFVWDVISNSEKTTSQSVKLYGAWDDTQITLQ